MLRYAIMGTNWLSYLYRDAILTAGDAVTAVCSRDLERAKTLGGENAKAYTDLDEMLLDPNIDAVYLCIPNVLHAEAALKCLKAGKHVLCEKPATVTAQQMEEIIRSAGESGKIFAEAVMNFYSPVMDQIREELKTNPVAAVRLDYSQRSSKLDQLRAGQSFSSFDRSLYGGVLTDLGCYALHFAVNLFGEPEDLIASSHFIGQVDGSTSLILRYGSFNVMISLSKCAHSMIGSEIQCDRASYTLKNLSVVLGVQKHTMTEIQELDCGIPVEKWPIANPAVLPGVQQRVIERFDRWVAGEDLAENQRLLNQSLTVQQLIEKAQKQIGY